MRRTIASTLIAVVGLLAMLFALPAAAPPRSANAASTLPGMCSGRSDAYLQVTAQASGAGSAHKVLLYVENDTQGSPSGILIVDPGPDQLLVDNLCRVWQHLPGQSPKGDCEETYPAGATTAHAVGIGEKDGQTMLARIDVRQLAGGQMLYRLRYRPWDPTSAEDEGGDSCEDAAWTWLPAEDSWSPLTSLSIGVNSDLNNLSVPAVFVPDTGPFTLTCGSGAPGELFHASGSPSSGFPLDPPSSYYVQGKNSWQAQCETALPDTVAATLGWGNTLTGKVKLTSGQPVRIVLSLSDAAAPAMSGFDVSKLDPRATDTASAYGIPATPAENGYVDNPVTPSGSTGVFDANASFEVYKHSTPDSPVLEGPAAALIDSHGSVVYSTTLVFPSGGLYVLRFVAPDVTLTATDAGSLHDSHTAVLAVAVGAPPAAPTTTTTTPPVTSTAPQATSSTAAATGTSSTTASANAAPASTSTGSDVGGASRQGNVVTVLTTTRRALSQLNAAIATTNTSIHKYHAASLRARASQLSIRPKLSADVARLETRLHSLLGRRRLIVSIITALQR